MHIFCWDSEAPPCLSTKWRWQKLPLHSDTPRAWAQSDPVQPGRLDQLTVKAPHSSDVQRLVQTQKEQATFCCSGLPFPGPGTAGKGSADAECGLERFKERCLNPRKCESKHSKTTGHLTNMHRKVIGHNMSETSPCRKIPQNSFMVFVCVLRLSVLLLSLACQAPLSQPA